MHPLRRTHWFIVSLLLSALTLAGCQTTRPQLTLTHMQPATVGTPSADKSYWKDTVTYPFPVHYATAKDARGNEWEIAYMDEYIGQTPKDEAKTLVLVHGKGTSAASWTQLMKEALESGLRVVAFDIPGYGKSIPGNLDAPKARTLQDTRVAVHDVLVNQLGIDKATYLGHSLGGQWVLGYALSYPEATEKLVLEAPAGLESYPKSFTFPSGEVPLFDPSYQHDIDKWNEVWAITGRMERERGQTEQSIRDFYWYKKRDAAGNQVPSDKGFFLPGSEGNPDALFETEARVGMLKGPKDELEQYILSTQRDVYSMGIETLKDDPNSIGARMSQITVPVFIAFGAEEPYIPTAAASGATDLKLEVIKPAYEKLAKQGPAPVVKIYPNAGHFVHTDVSEQFGSDVVSFVYNGSVSGDTEDPAKYKAGAVTLPPDIKAFIEADVAAVKANDVNAAMAGYHKDFLSDGRNWDAQKGVFMQYGDQLAKKYDVDITELKIDGDMAEINGSITTIYGKASLKGTKLIKEDGQWKWYGNRK